MAKKKLFKSKSNFTLKRLHQSGSYGNIYERDYATISNTTAIPNGQIPIYGSPTFKLSVRAGLNGQKKYNYGDWVSNPNNCENNTFIWTLGCMPEPDRNDSKINLKLDKTKLTDYACFGSALELIRTSVKNIIARFPAEIYISNKSLSDTHIFDTGTIPYSSDLYKKNKETLYVVENPLLIDILQAVREDDSAYSIYAPQRYMCETQYDYVIIQYDKVIKDSKDYKDNNKSFWVVKPESSKDCLNNGDLIATVSLGDIEILCYYYEGDILYVSDSNGLHIRPNEKIIENFFNNLSDFEKILLNRYTEYVSIFETYEEDKENGWYSTEKKYKWPLDKGGWNIAVNTAQYLEYFQSLEKLGANCDYLFTDAIWRNMTHEGIYNMDLTSQNNDGEFITVDSSKVRKTMNIIGRQFDEIKKYSDNIKNTNKISYDQNNNMPDYFLSENLNLSGWETKEILNNISNDIITQPMYGSRVIGFSASDANNEFMRRLKLNSKNILRKKGTKQGIEDLMSVFGFHSIDWIESYYTQSIKELEEAYEKIKNTQDSSDTFVATRLGHIKDKIENLKNDEKKAYKNAFMMMECVYVTTDYTYADKENTPKTTNEFVDEVINLNTSKDSYLNGDYENDTITDGLEGIPVVEVNIEDKKMIVPWFDKNKKYDSDAYFQMKGGWSRNDGKVEIKTIDGETTFISDNRGVYDYTVSKIHFVRNLDTLYDLTYQSIDVNGYYYVGDSDVYYKIKDIDKHTLSDGWEEVNEQDIIQIKNIVDNNKGNNPHCGYYDDGVSYVETFGNLFKYADFTYVRHDDVVNNKLYGFNIKRLADSTKCLFFHNYVNKDEYSNLNRSEQLRGENMIKPHNFFDEDEFNEAASLSIINSKELHISFSETYRDFIENDVLHYLKQIIPSTTIFSYDFINLEDYDRYGNYLAKVKNVICDGDIIPIYGTTE